MSLHLSRRGERVAAGGLGLLRAENDTNATCALADLQLRAEDRGLAHPLLSAADTDAWYGLGDCLYHDNAIIPTDGDSTKPRFRADRNASLRAFRTVLALDSTYHLAYQHVVDMYNLQTLGNVNSFN